MISLIFATNNAHKVEEIQAAIGTKITVISLEKAGINVDIPEPHPTLEQNATEKSATIHQLTRQNCFSEDTGLEVEALNGEPGVKSARYAGDDRSFDKNIDKVLNKLEGKDEFKAVRKTTVQLFHSFSEEALLETGSSNGSMREQDEQ
ncbi:MAG: non-canonical purine NTP pyrophosphatase [Chitinophagaceae bacterium]|nr:MAG: non-canonical purine NTP pyrophosphatase [Chitinophagaceae bacterium]